MQARAPRRPPARNPANALGCLTSTTTMRSFRATSRLAARRLARKVLEWTDDDAPRAKAPPRGRRAPKTVATGWDTYAKQRRMESRIGDDWNRARSMGLDVENPADVVGHLDRVVFTPFLGESNVLVEIGPGGGRFTEVLVRNSRVVHAVDTSPHMIESLRARFGEDRGVVYHVADGRGLGMLADGSADAAFSYGVFVHLQHWDIFNYLTEVERVLRPGGKAIIQHSNTFSELGWRRFQAEVPRQLNRRKLRHTFTVNSPQLMAEFIHRAELEVVEMVTNVAKRDCIALLRKPASPNSM
jgi:SAM-dependent methyltransferase